ncbi:MAG: ATP-binding protein [Planctomycetota bacterium]
MTRLFIRFYLSVIGILVVAVCIMSFAFRYRIDTDFYCITERAMGGGVRQARETLETKTGAAAVVALEKLRGQFNYPIRIISHDQVPTEMRESLSKGDEVVLFAGNQLSVLTPMGTGTEALQFGPVSQTRGSVETDMKIAVAAVLLLVAIAIACLLRPLARQLSVLEQTAISIAGGNFGARVDLQKADSAIALARAFNDMAARTEALLRTQRELLQAVSHELRTPLARINFAIDLIRTSRDDRERESRLKSLDTAAQELDELVGELLQYVRLETSLPQPVWESIDLLPLVEELIEKSSLVCETLQFEVGPELARGDVRLVADRIGLTRVLSNLLANASRFGQRRVIVDVRVSPTGATIDVDDDGPGILESDRERVFEPFVRLEETGRGAGLGLALVKRIVANHSGTVMALESPLGGCRIRTFWPATSSASESTKVLANQAKLL